MERVIWCGHRQSKRLLFPVNALFKHYLGLEPYNPSVNSCEGAFYRQLLRFHSECLERGFERLLRGTGLLLIPLICCPESPAFFPGIERHILGGDQT